jgi:uncharacterized protein
MGPYDDQIRELNPWWHTASAVDDDPHLRELARFGFKWDPPALTAIPLVPGGVHTLRGPRQVGKSTSLKRLIRRLVDAGERRVLYFSFDLERRNRAIRDVVMRAKRLHPDPDGPWFIFLDEVTSIEAWQLGIKYLWDNGTIRDDLVICTGSSARRMGAEQLPGRRGNGRDFVHLPMSFRAFCRSVLDLTLPERTVTAEEWLTPSGERLARELNLQAEALSDAVDLYARVGGFPAAVRDHITHGATGESTIRMVWEIIAGDIQEGGYDKHSALRLLERVGVGLGSPLAWSTLREAMDVGSHNTAKAYTHLLSESFILLTIFQWAQGGGFRPERQRKIYFVDPLLAQIASTLIPGGRKPNEDGLREGIVAAALFASAAHRLTLADPLPGSVGFWKSSDGRETDFVVPSKASVPVEVKGDSKRGVSGARLSMRRTFGKGIVVTRTTFDPDEIPALPMGVFLAGLAPRSERRSAEL